MFLASAQLCEWPEDTKIEEKVLATKIRSQQTKRYPQSKTNESSWMELPPNLGVPAETTSGRTKAYSPPSQNAKALSVLELFAGGGGLALALSASGCRHIGAIEWNREACNTIRQNQRIKENSLGVWPVIQADVSKFDFGVFGEEVDLLAGGPPCQPFSQGGAHKGSKDHRDMFPEMVRAVRELHPKAVVIENVRGLTRRTFQKYYDYILLQLSYPLMQKRKGESWKSHHIRLSRAKVSNAVSELKYNVSAQVLNAADFGVPQWRERLFIVAIRSDLKISWTFPKATHSLDALLYEQWITGKYWKRRKIQRRSSIKSDSRYKFRIQSLIASGKKPSLLPWVTVRDAISDLPNPLRSKSKSQISNHIHNPGARAYDGHTGSNLDLPAKTLKAGSHGVPGGENMLANGNGKVRYFTVRECARIQTFPDSYEFTNVWCSAMRQLGNAVPVLLGQVVVQSVVTALSSQLSKNFPKRKPSPAIHPIHLPPGFVGQRVGV